MPEKTKSRIQPRLTIMYPCGWDAASIAVTHLMSKPGGATFMVHRQEDGSANLWLSKASYDYLMRKLRRD